MYIQKQRKFESFLICFIIIMNIFFGISPVYAEGDTVVLNGPDESADKVFTVENMFPGDNISRDYVLNISHRENIDVMFKADVRENSEILAEVLKIKVTIPDAKETLYDGPMKDMPASVTYTLPGNVQKLTYNLTVYLDTTVGNKTEIDPTGKRYQYKTLTADFSWWYMPESSGGGGGGSGGGNVGDKDDEDIYIDKDDEDEEEDEEGKDEGLTKMLRRAYVYGRPGQVFEPEAPITRAETSAIFARLFADYNDHELVATDTEFNDVDESAWFARYISRLQDENIIFGFNGDFRPNDNITRAEFAAICVRFFEKRSESRIIPRKIDFIDFDRSHWSYETIEKAYANGYVSGYPDHTLRADHIITRAEAVTIVNRMLERIPDKEYIDNNLHKLIDFIDLRDNTYWAYYEIFEAANTHYIRFVDNFARWVD